MAALTATATCTGFRAVEEATGELVPGRLLAERVGFLTTLIQAMSTSVVATRWTDADLAALEVGVGPDGRALPARGWMALRRLGWAAVAPEGVYVSDRVRRVAEEDAARVLRLAVYRRAVVHAIVGTWPADPRRRSDAEWGVLRGRLPHVVSNAELRNRTRQVRAFKADHGGRLPAGLTELEAAPRTGGMVLLAAADKQLVTIQRTGAHAAVLRVQLPLTGRPTSPTQWAWHAIRLAVPEHTPAEASLCVPTLRVVGGRVRVDLPWRVPAPSAPRAGHTVALGLDWGVNTLLTGTVGKLADTPTGTRVVTDGRMLRFDTTGSLRSCIGCAATARRSPPAATTTPDCWWGCPPPTPAGSGSCSRPSTPSWPQSTSAAATASATSTTPWPGRQLAGPSTRPTRLARPRST